ncbi:MAG: ABC transporter permease [Erysipelotrichaceae bacterium]|nr:ABC transporter permease [Erysipelotrichaceae bacterium]
MIKSISDFKASIKRKKIIIFVIQFLLLFFFLGCWEILARLNIINEFLLSKPSSIISLFFSYLRDGTLFKHLLISTFEALIALIISTFFGIAISILLYLSDTVTKIIDPFLTVLNAIPKSASGIIFIIWFGTSYKGIIAVSVSFSIVITIINCLSYFKSVDKEYIKMVQVMGANKFQILTKVILPSSFENLLSLLKVNIGLSWVGIVVGEFLVSKEGIGYLILYGGQVFKMDLVMMGILVLSFIALGMYHLINLLQKLVRKLMNHN